MIHALILYLAIQASAAETVDQHQAAGVAALKAAQNSQAILEFKRVIELDPTDGPGYYGFGVAYMQSGGYGCAISPLKKVLDLESSLMGVPFTLGYWLFWD